MLSRQRPLPQRTLRVSTLGAAVSVACLAAPDVLAEPQVNAAVTAGVGGRGETSPFERAAFVGGLRGDVMLGRRSARDFGLGPYGALETAAFDDARIGVGASSLLPVTAPLPLVVSVGPLLRVGPATQLGLSARLFVGSRSYNPYSPYVMAGGLVFGIDRTFGDGPETVVLVAAQIDALLLAMPFLLGYQALLGD